MAINGNTAPVKNRTTRIQRWFIAVACAIVLAWPMVIFCGQYREFFAMRAENEHMRHEILALKAEQQHLRKEQAALTTPQGMEREARRLGYLRPGEARLSVPE